MENIFCFHHFHRFSLTMNYHEWPNRPWQTLAQLYQRPQSSSREDGNAPGSRLQAPGQPTGSKLQAGRRNPAVSAVARGKRLQATW